MKWLFSGIAALVLIVLIVVGALYFSMDGLTRRGIEHGTSYATGTPVSLQSADLSVRRGELKLAELEIGNPAGFEAPYFMRVGEGDVAVTLGSLLGEEVEVPRLHLKGLDINLERREGKNNYDVILENLEKLQGPPEEQPEDGKKYVIREIVISDVVVKAAIFPVGGESRVLTIKIPDIRLTDVGSDTEQGVLLSQVSGVVMQAVMQAVVEQAGDVLPAAIASGLQSGLTGLGDLSSFGLESIGSGTGRVLSDITGNEAIGEALEGVGSTTGETLRGVGDAVGEGLGGLLGGDRDDDAEQEDDSSSDEAADDDTP